MPRRSLALTSLVTLVIVAAFVAGTQAKSPSGEYRIGVLEPVLEGAGRDLLGDELLKRAYLGL